ncbi:MAG: Uma2 family endonuclease [Verrucomicrobiales bacterium]|nr:Uma2 family endonuclease [Verrucomicrobiales bacterium]
MSSRRTEPRRWTYAELAATLPENNLPTELWDGELVTSPAPSFLHQEIVDRLHDRLKAWVRSHRLGKTATAPVDMVLAPRRAVQPDLVLSPTNGWASSASGSKELTSSSRCLPGHATPDRSDKRDLYDSTASGILARGPGSPDRRGAVPRTRGVSAGGALDQRPGRLPTAQRFQSPVPDLL